MIPKKVTDATTASAIIENFNRPGILTNCYLMGGDLEKLVDENRLFVLTSDSNAVFLEDKDNCYRVHYLINDENETFNFDISKPLMLEILFREPGGLNQRHVEYWEKQGFRTNVVRRNLAAKFSELGISKGMDTVYVRTATNIEEALFARNLFNSVFDPYSGDYISEVDIKTLLENGQLLIAQSSNTPIGALHFYKKGKCTWLGHVAVKSQKRGLGAGRSLVYEYIMRNQDDEKSRYSLWVQAQNQAACSMYERFGFKYAGKSSLSMIRK